MKYYIATSLARAAVHNKVRNCLQELGHELSYDWTEHGSVKHVSTARLKEVATLELQGILESDFVVVLLPGGRGTHTELGFAIGSNKKVFLHSEDPSFFDLGSQTCAFYYYPNLTRLCCLISDLGTVIHANLCQEVRNF